MTKQNSLILVAREMSNEMDVRRLIAEVEKRPQLWDFRMAEYKDRTNTLHLWNEIAEIMGFDVEHCKRKWKNLRDAYRAEVRRTERRIARLKALGQWDPMRRTASKWVFFEPMSFINETKRTSYTSNTATGTGSPQLMNDAEADNSGSQDLVYPTGFHSFCDIKMETHHTTDDDDDDDENEKLFEEFNAVATPQAVRRLSDCIATAAAAAEVSAAVQSVATAGSLNVNCKCSNRADDQVHFLEDLEREEKKLMQSTRKEITRANSVGHVGDADYNFLVSFLPQMKKMSELQNLQFRAKMSELLLMTMSPPSACLPHSTTPAVGCMQAPMVATIAPKREQHQEVMPHQLQTQVVCPATQLATSRAGEVGGGCIESRNGSRVGVVEEQVAELLDMKNGSTTGGNQSIADWP